MLFGYVLTVVVSAWGTIGMSDQNNFGDKVRFDSSMLHARNSENFAYFQCLIANFSLARMGVLGSAHLVSSLRCHR